MAGQQILFILFGTLLVGATIARVILNFSIFIKRYPVTQGTNAGEQMVWFFIFYWTKKNNDPTRVKRRIRIVHLLSILSILAFAGILYASTLD